MKCAACQFENPSGMRFCGQCGTALARQCPQCHAEAPPGFRFCGQCGASLQAAPPQAAPAPTPRAPAAAPSIATYTPKHLADKILKSRAAVEGERRQVTVLFADVAGFTALAERLDPEDVHRIINRCFELITAEVHRFEGTINQYTGDGVMALFGAPIAHEDSPRRAAHAALGIQGAVRDYGKQLQAERPPLLADPMDSAIYRGLGQRAARAGEPLTIRPDRRDDAADHAAGNALRVPSGDGHSKYQGAGRADRSGARAGAAELCQA